MQASDIQDLVTTSLDQLGRLQWTDLSSDYQNTVALKRLFRKNKMQYGGGPNVRFNVQFDTNGSSRTVGLGFTAIVDIPNTMTYGSVPWSRKTFNWAMDIEEPVINSGESKIIDLLKTRRIAALGSFTIDVERGLWAAPDATNFAGSEPDFLGIPYWVVKSNTAFSTTNEGFNGGAPSGFTDVGGLSPTTYPRWKNYAEQYTAVTKDDLIRRMRRAMKYIDFMPLVDETPTYNVGDDYGCYTNEPVLSTLEEILEDQNENLGSDIAPMDGKVMFARSPVVFVKELNRDTTNPVYILNWGELGSMRRSGFWMKEIPVPVNPNQPTISATHVISSFNTICRNRRRQAVIATDTSMPS
jgi:hypothetical protein